MRRGFLAPAAIVSGATLLVLIQRASSPRALSVGDGSTAPVGSRRAAHPATKSSPGQTRRARPRGRPALRRLGPDQLRKLAGRTERPARLGSHEEELREDLKDLSAARLKKLGIKDAGLVRFILKIKDEVLEEMDKERGVAGTRSPLSSSKR